MNEKKKITEFIGKPKIVLFKFEPLLIIIVITSDKCIIRIFLENYVKVIL